MSCSFTPDVQQAYEAVRDERNPQTWMMLGYAGTRDRLSVSSVGTGGVEEMKERLIPGEVHFGVLAVEGRLLLWNWLPEGAVNGVRRARALVHSRVVAGAFSVHGSISASRLSDLNAITIRQKLKLDDSTSVPSSPLRLPPSPPLNTPFQSLYAPAHTYPLPDSPARPEIPRALTPTFQHPYSKSYSPTPHSPPSYPRSISPQIRTTSPLHSSTTSYPTSSLPPSPNLLSGDFHGRTHSDSTGSTTPDNGTFGCRSPVVGKSEEGGSHAESEEREERGRVEREKRELVAVLKAREDAEERERERRREEEEREGKRLEWEEGQVVIRRMEAELRAREAEEEQEREEERLLEEERRREEEEREREEMVLMREREEAMEHLRRVKAEEKAREDIRRKAEEKSVARGELMKRFEVLRGGDKVMLEGPVSVQGGDSIMFRRRWFELRGQSLTLYKEKGSTTAISTIPLSSQVKIKDVEPDESLPLNAFRLAIKPDDDSTYLLYTDDQEDKEILVAGLKIAACLS